MNMKLKSIFNFLLAFVILFLLVFSIILIFRTIINLLIPIIIKLTEITSNLDVVVIVALITGAVSIISVITSSIIGKILDYNQNIKRYLYEKREEPYSEFINMVYRLQENIDIKGSYPEDEMKRDIMKFSRLLTLYGSNRVIKKWLTFKNNSLVPESEENNLIILEDIIFEIRKDMGQRKGALNQGDLLAFFVNDIHEHIKNTKNNTKKKEI